MLSLCPTIWKMTSVDARHWVHDVMKKTYPLGVFRDRTKERTETADLRPITATPVLDDIRAFSVLQKKICRRETRTQWRRSLDVDLQVRIAGFGGQGVLLLGEVLAEAGVSSWRRIDDNAIPPRGKICGAYANSVLASDDIRRSGFDEAILLNESGHVTEGATCNLFMLRKGRLVTPLVTEGVLEGITRDCVTELAQHELALEVVERPVNRSELYICDELFLTGTAVGLAPVTRVDHRAVGDGQIGAVTRRLRQLYVDATRGRLPAYRKWLLRVYGGARTARQEAARMKEPSFA